MVKIERAESRVVAEHSLGSPMIGGLSNRLVSVAKRRQLALGARFDYVILRAPDHNKNRLLQKLNFWSSLFCR